MTQNGDTGSIGHAENARQHGDGEWHAECSAEDMNQHHRASRASRLLGCVGALVLAHPARAYAGEPLAGDPAEPATLVVEVRLAEGSPPDDAVVLQREETKGHWAGVCVAPCTARIPAGTRLRVEGASILASTPAVLQGRADEHVRLDVAPAYARDRGERTWLGGFLVGAGVVSAFAGAVSIFLSGLAHTGLSCDPKDTQAACYNDDAHRAADTKEARLRTGGIVFILSGAAVAGAGAVALHSAGSMASRATLSNVGLPSMAPRWSVGAMPLRRGGGAALSLRF